MLTIFNHHNYLSGYCLIFPFSPFPPNDSTLISTQELSNSMIAFSRIMTMKVKK